jgi:transcription initiation factor IIE alpha subunit
MTRQTHLCPTHSSRQPSQPTCPACRHERRLVIHDRRIRALEATIERLEAELAALESSSAGASEAET